MQSIYESVRTLRPRRSAFNLSHTWLGSMDMGQLVPFLFKEAIPGDIWKIGLECVARTLPQVVPVLHEFSVYAHYFFVPTRLLWTDWEEFITGGVAGTDAHSLPTWIPTHGDVVNGNGLTVKDNGVGSLWDYFGLPVTDAGIIPAGAYPLAFPRRAYNLVFNQYYRDQQQTAEISLDGVAVKNRTWEKDYLTSALPWQQRGVAPALPISIGGSTNAVWPADFWAGPVSPDSGTHKFIGQTTSPFNVISPASNPGTGDYAAKVAKTQLDNNTIAGSAFTATGIDVPGLRLAFQIQKWMERNARGGVRYIEFLQNHFGVAPKDERLQRAEYIGGTRLPIIVSEVLQTSATGTSPQGNMAGHGLGVGRDSCVNYHVQEHGYIIGIVSVMPRAAYSQGIDRELLRQTRYDFYSPEFAHLSEQAITLAEVWATNSAGTGAGQNGRVFGYQGRHNELRSAQSKTVGLMRYGVAGHFGYWHMARNFGSEPVLNEAFITCIPRKDWLAAPSQPAMIMHLANVIKAVRPMPIEAEPGLIDHA
ncbi:MAG: major capsid protein [Microvirus sp.]|nr:MAG: major capsid protein [Microvirus sp.]